MKIRVFIDLPWKLNNIHWTFKLYQHSSNFFVIMLMIMFFLMPRILTFLELIKLVPAGTSKTQVMLQAGGIGCADGGETGAFTPMWLMVARKPLK